MRVQKVFFDELRQEVRGKSVPTPVAESTLVETEHEDNPNCTLDIIRLMQDINSGKINY